MRRGAGYVLVGLGAFLLVLALLLPTFVVPRVERVPEDEYGTSVATGRGLYLDPTRDFTAVRDAEVTVTRILRGDVEQSSDDARIADYSQTVQVSGLDDPLDVVQERVAYDAESAVGTGGDGDRPDHEGSYVFKFPFDTRKVSYDVWEPSARAAAPVQFVRETEVQGLDVYEFRGVVEPTVIAEQGIPGALVGAPDVSSVFAEQVYSTERAFLVEPRTGIVVGGSSSPRRTLRPAEGLGEVQGTETPVFEAELTTTEQSLTEAVDDAKDARGQLTLLGRTLPIVLGLLGLLALAVGIALTLRERRTPPAHAYDASDAATVSLAKDS